MNENDQIVRIGQIDGRERRKRQLELYAAGAIASFVAICTWLQLTFYELNSWLFIFLFDINALLMLIILFLVARNVVKLIIERRRNIFGARIRSRMVTIFVMLTFVPTVCLFLASNRLVGTGIDYWFTSQTENAFQAALDIGHSFYTAAAVRLHERSIILLQENKTSPALSPKLLHEAFNDYGLHLVGIVDEKGFPETLHAESNPNGLWQEIRSHIDWRHAKEEPFYSLLWSNDNTDYAIGLLPLNDGTGRFLITAENIGQGVMAKLKRISRGFEEYARLKDMRKPLKVSIQLILAVLSLLVLCGSIWYGFRLSKEFTAPLLALADGTARIAKGELDFRLQDEGSDEIAQLVRAFNLMAEELSDSLESLTRANALLSRLNLTMDERRLYIETVLDNITTGVITLGQDNKLQTINKAACTMFHTSLAILYGRVPAEFLPADYVPIYNDMQESLRIHPDRNWQRQLDFIMAGRIWKLVVTAVALNTAGQVQSTIVVIEDITDLEKMQRMAAWREVARRIAHEIKNPLTPIKLSAQRLARKFGNSGNPVFTQCTDLIVSQTERLQEMVQEFSSFAKLPEVNLKPGHVESLFDELLAVFRGSHPRITWETRFEKEIPPILMDADALHRAFVNLMNNAAEAIEDMPQSDRKFPPHRVRITIRKEPALKCVRILVADTGPGLTPEEHAHLFEPYFSRKKGGTGLGLAIVKSIITDHRGSIHAAASEEGTTMTVDIPQYTPSLTASRLAQNQVQAKSEKEQEDLSQKTPSG